jgi:hypothetical protein
MTTKKTNKKNVQYIPGATGDGYGFFPAITCRMDGGRVLWIVRHQRRQLPMKHEALLEADKDIASGFRIPSLPASPSRFLEHLRQRGYAGVEEHRTARSFDEDRRSALGDEHQPAFGDAAAQHDPLLHAAVMRLVDEQIAANDPPETGPTVERLLAAGYSPEYIRRMIGFLLIREINLSYLEQKPFNRGRFVEVLERLPEIPPPW